MSNFNPPCPSCGGLLGIHYAGCHLVRAREPSQDPPAKAWIAFEIPLEINRCPYDDWKPERTI